VTPAPGESGLDRDIRRSPSSGEDQSPDAGGVVAGRGPLLVLGGGLAAAGFVVLAVQLGRRRATAERP
jgi:hypothetical protein